jgi:hypothetical protein
VTHRPIARERVTNTFLYRWILGNQRIAVGSTGVSVDTDTIYKGRSDQNEVSHSSCQNRERPEWSQQQSSQNGASPRQSFIVSYYKLL